jgi:hypothetical protein
MDDENTVEEETTEETEAPEAEVETEEDEPESFDADKAREKIRKINSENRNLRKRASEAEAKAQDSEGKDGKLTALEAENMRLKIGIKHGLDANLLDRLKGDTEEELLEDAEKLLELFSGRKPPTQQPREKLRGGGDPTRQHNEDLDDLDKFAADVFKN